MAETKSEKMEFVTIVLSRKQIDFDTSHVSERNGKDYARIMGPDGGTFFYPKESLKQAKDDPDHFYFSRPVGTIIQLHFSRRVEGVPDEAPNSEKFESQDMDVAIEDLHEWYENSKKEFKEKKISERENNPFVNVSVPSEWGRHFTSKDGKELVSISFPVVEGDQRNYYSFIIPAERFKESTLEEGKSYFGFPKFHEVGEFGKEPYIVCLKRSEKDVNGEWIDFEEKMSSVEVAECLKAAQKAQNFVSVEISEKLVHPFDYEGKSLVSVSVPVFDAEQGRDVFYNITMPEKMVDVGSRDGQKKIVMGKDFEFNAKRSVKDESTGQYKDILVTMTGLDVINHFRESKTRYQEAHNEQVAEQPGDKSADGPSVPLETQIQQRHKRGR